MVRQLHLTTSFPVVYIVKSVLHFVKWTLLFRREKTNASIRCIGVVVHDGHSLYLIKGMRHQRTSHDMRRYNDS